jgi:hypothetical protein
MTVTQERIDIIRQLYKSDISVDIQDMVLPDGSPGGTKVTLQMGI